MYPLGMYPLGMSRIRATKGCAGLFWPQARRWQRVRGLTRGPRPGNRPGNRPGTHLINVAAMKVSLPRGADNIMKGPPTLPDPRSSQMRGHFLLTHKAALRTAQR